jgi:hypothetical protein
MELGSGLHAVVKCVACVPPPPPHMCSARTRPPLHRGCDSGHMPGIAVCTALLGFGVIEQWIQPSCRQQPAAVVWATAVSCRLALCCGAAPAPVRHLQAWDRQRLSVYNRGTEVISKHQLMCWSLLAHLCSTGPYIQVCLGCLLEPTGRRLDTVLTSSSQYTAATQSTQPGWKWMCP